MNPLLSFWIKVQPLAGCCGGHTWKAISQSSALVPSTGDDAVVSRTGATYSWAFDHLRSSASRLASHVYWDIFYWASSSWLFNPSISRMHDAPVPILKPSSRAVCEGIRRCPTRKVTTSLDAKFLTKGNEEITPLLQSQQILQHQDYLNYQIQPNLARRNSKEWVPQYKKERIDKINYNNVFGGASEASNNEIPTLPPPRVESESRTEFGERKNPTFSSVRPDSPKSSSSTDVESVGSLPSARPAKIIPNVDGPAPVDVICGRGGKANTHPGNISFREEARKLRSWYESSSKSEKFTISSFLVDIVRERGGRFLKRDRERPGGWSEADADDVRKKASQALREGRKGCHNERGGRQ